MDELRMLVRSIAHSLEVGRLDTYIDSIAELIKWLGSNAAHADDRRSWIEERDSFRRWRMRRRQPPGTEPEASSEAADRA